GRFLEAVADADTIVFDKTGTLTKAQAKVREVVSFNGQNEDDLLCLAACLEEHYPHSLAKAVVDAAIKHGQDHEEMHSKVEYVVAHGISSSVDGKKVIIGSYHFVFEDEACKIPEETKARFCQLPRDCSHLYMAIDGKLAAVICIEDPIREEAADAIEKLRKCGIEKVVMMTGDSDRTAKAIAEQVGVDEYYAEVLPEDKAKFVADQKAMGRTVIMVGDGINDSPALSVSDAGIAISDGAELAREIADITISADDLYQLVTLKKIANKLMERIRSNYGKIVGFNSSLILLGVLGVIQPTTSAMLHNSSTILISLDSMRKMDLEDRKRKKKQK
ncbi:MAG: HAD-IC family P-type ATPase, partial [Eubacterium sp.]|nr:HAD-IC family P-type ATPase [Eubacterium sp.]